MSTARHGILAGGHWIVDRTITIDSWPAQDTLVRISDESPGNGGCAYNLLKGLSRLECGFPLEGVGLLGSDENAAWILDDCTKTGIGAGGLRQTEKVATSYTYVMTAATDGRRTFFHQPGANALLSPGDFDLRASSARIFHLGYLALLQTLDEVGADGRTGASRLFEEAVRLGMVTMTDLVSSDAGDFPGIIAPSLPWVDWLFLNEFEAARLTGRAMPDAGDAGALFECAAGVLAMGVRRGVFLHTVRGALCLERDGARHLQAAVRVPNGLIKGTAGAGDAFGAGCVLGLHEGWPVADCLELGVCTAAASLRDPSCSAAIVPSGECLAFGRTHGFSHFSIS